jgi:hypothetical protein
MRVRRLLQCKSLPFHVGSLSAIQSASGWRVDLGSFIIDSDKPRYMMGKSTLWQGKMMVARLIYSSAQ